MRCFNRETKKYVELEDHGQNALYFLYNNAFGRLLLKLMVGRCASILCGLYNNSPLSALKIKRFVAKNHIRMKDFEDRKYRSFNDFFTRKIKPGARKVDMNENSLISPCDAKLMVYDITQDLKVDVKGSIYTLKELTGRKLDLTNFEGGKCLIFRLGIEDYHRYTYPDNGTILYSGYIRGKLHTVRSIAADYKVYKENARAVSFLETKNFGNIIQIEVGAMFVGKIVNNVKRIFKKGEEKGHFELGGSSIVLLMQNGKAVIDQDILQQSSKGIETIVKYGEKIGNCPAQL